MNVPTGARLALSLGCNFLLPWALYRLSVAHVGETRALIISAAAPALWGAVQHARTRRTDAMSVLVLVGITLALSVVVLGGPPKVLLLRESIVTGLIGIVFIVSALIGWPLLYMLLRGTLAQFDQRDQTVPVEGAAGTLARASAQLQEHSAKPWFRHIMSVTTVLCGCILLAEMAARIVLITHLPTERVLLLTPILGYGAAVCIGLVTFLYFVPTIRRNVNLEEEAASVSQLRQS